MNKNELKKILKPLIKECIKEVLFETDGALSHVIKEVAVGLSGKQQITENRVVRERPQQNNDFLKQKKKQLLDSIGKNAYNGVNIFEGTTPTTSGSPEASTRGPLSDMDPRDPGVDISKIFNSKAFAMTQKLMEKK